MYGGLLRSISALGVSLSDSGSNFINSCILIYSVKSVISYIIVYDWSSVIEQPRKDCFLIKPYSNIVTSLFYVVMDLLMVILCIQFFYAALGYELFGSTEVTKSQLLFGSNYTDKDEYYAYD